MNFVDLKENTIFAKRFISEYNNPIAWSVAGAYAKPSKAKQEAEDKIKQEMELLQAEDYRVITACNQLFTAGFRYHKDGKHYLCILTGFNNYRIDVSDYHLEA